MTVEKKDPRYFVAMIPDANLIKLYYKGNSPNLGLSPSALIYNMIHAVLYGDIISYRNNPISDAAKKMGFYCEELEDLTEESINKAKIKWFNESVSKSNCVGPITLSVIEGFPNIDNQSSTSNKKKEE